MSEIVGYVGIGSLGALVGLPIGMYIAKKVGMTPHARELSKALEEERSYYKSMIGRFRGRLKEYEQPSELQQMVNQVGTGSAEDLVKMFTSNLGGIRGLPRWVRPFIPAITSYATEHPQEIQALLSKFLSSSSRGVAGEQQTDESL